MLTLLAKFSGMPKTFFIILFYWQTNLGRHNAYIVLLILHEKSYDKITRNEKAWRQPCWTVLKSPCINSMATIHGIFLEIDQKNRYFIRLTSTVNVIEINIGNSDSESLSAVDEISD